MIPITIRCDLGSVTTLYSSTECPYVHLKQADFLQQRERAFVTFFKPKLKVIGTQLKSYSTEIWHGRLTCIEAEKIMFPQKYFTQTDLLMDISDREREKGGGCGFDTF